MYAPQWNSLANFGATMNRLQRDMDRMLGRFSDGNGRRAAAAYPPLDLWQDADNLYVEAELPGMAMDDLEIYVSGGNQLSLQGQRKPPAVEKGNWHRQERGYGQFSRVVTLPDIVDADNVQAQLRDGVLTITLPKREEAKPRRIAVRSE
mgnify:CR=1 FL=1